MMPQRKRKKNSASDLSHHFRVQPKANYKMYGTRIVLDKKQEILGFGRDQSTAMESGRKGLCVGKGRWITSYQA